MSDDIIKRLRGAIAEHPLSPIHGYAADITALIDRLDKAERHILTLEGGLDAVLEFASTVAGSSSWWEEVWPEHSSAIDAARAAEQREWSEE